MPHIQHMQDVQCVYCMSRNICNRSFKRISPKMESGDVGELHFTKKPLLQWHSRTSTTSRMNKRWWNHTMNELPLTFSTCMPSYYDIIHIQYYCTNRIYEHKCWRQNYLTMASISKIRLDAVHLCHLSNTIGIPSHLDCTSSFCIYVVPWTISSQTHAQQPNDHHCTCMATTAPCLFCHNSLQTD